MFHSLRIGKPFADAIVAGELTFDVRSNENGLQKGDTVAFEAYDGILSDSFHPISDKRYRVVYVMSGKGLENGHVAFSFEEIGETE